MGCGVIVVVLLMLGQAVHIFFLNHHESFLPKHFSHRVSSDVWVNGFQFVGKPNNPVLCLFKILTIKIECSFLKVKTEAKLSLQQMIWRLHEGLGNFSITNAPYVFQRVDLAPFLYFLWVLAPLQNWVSHLHKPILSSITVVVSLAKKAAAFTKTNYFSYSFGFVILEIRKAFIGG